MMFLVANITAESREKQPLMMMVLLLNKRADVLRMNEPMYAALFTVGSVSVPRAILSLPSESANFDNITLN
jgi:hypothetical protein